MHVSPRFSSIVNRYDTVTLCAVWLHNIDPSCRGSLLTSLRWFLNKYNNKKEALDLLLKNEPIIMELQKTPGWLEEIVFSLRQSPVMQIFLIDLSKINHSSVLIFWVKNSVQYFSLSDKVLRLFGVSFWNEIVCESQWVSFFHYLSSFLSWCCCYEGIKYCISQYFVSGPAVSWLRPQYGSSKF